MMMDDAIRAKVAIYDFTVRIKQLFSRNITEQNIEKRVRAALGFCSNLEAYGHQDIYNFLATITSTESATEAAFQIILETTLNNILFHCETGPIIYCDDLEDLISDYSQDLYEQLLDPSIKLLYGEGKIEEISNNILILFQQLKINELK